MRALTGSGHFDHLIEGCGPLAIPTRMTHRCSAFLLALSFGLGFRTWLDWFGFELSPSFLALAATRIAQRNLFFGIEPSEGLAIRQLGDLRSII
jgi:hypothetical protein